MPDETQEGSQTVSTALPISPIDGEIQVVNQGSTIKKRSRKEKTGEERPSKRVKVKESVSVSANDGFDSQKAHDEAKATPKKRGRRPKATVEGGDLVGDTNSKDSTVKASTATDGPARRGRPPKVRIEGRASIPKESPTKKGKGPKGKGKENGTDSIPILKWKLVQAPPASAAATSGNLPELTQKPRIWFSSRDELLSTLPELTGSKCINGLSWELYETPILLLDEANSAFQVTHDDTDPRSIDLVTTREFVRSIPQKKQEPLPEIAPGVTLDKVDLSVHQILPETPNAPILSPDPGPGAYLAKMEPQMYQISPETDDPAIPNPSTKPARKYASIKINKLVAATEESSSAPLHIDFFSPLPMFSISHTNAYNAPTCPNIWFEPPRTVNAGMQTSSTVKSDRSGNFAHILPLTSVEVYNSHHAPPTIPSNLPGFDEPVTHQPQQLPLLSPTEEQRSLEESNVQSYPKQKMKSAYRILRGPQAEIVNTPEQRQENVDSGSGLNLGSDQATNLPVRNSIPAVICTADIPRTVMPKESTSTNKLEPSSEVNSNADLRPKIEPEDSILVLVGDQAPGTTQVPEATQAPDVTQASEGPQKYQELVPTPLPQEIQAIIDAYLFGMPLTLIVSRGRFLTRWSLLLSKDIGYAMMGYFKVIGIQETRVEPTGPPDQTNGLQSLSGQVQWLFRLQWRPGGEKFIMPKSDPRTLEYPWWAPAPDTKDDIDIDSEETQLPEKEAEAIADATSTPPDSEDDFPTTARYRQARLAHHEYVFRHDHYDELYESLLPTSLLAQFGPSVSDSAFPRGWFCEECGQVNYQTALRHRICTNPSCKETPSSAKPYAVELVSMRDPQDRLPISHPYNTHPSSIEPKVLTYVRGVKTITYSFNSSCITHIFTGNFEELQKNATALLDQIQIQVELKRPFNDNSPYFSYSAKAPRKMENPTENPWPNVPDCMNKAKAAIYSRARTFSGLEDSRISVNRLTLLAWITAGVRKGPEILRAKKKCVIIVAFGCDVVLTLNPRSIDLPAAQRVPDDVDSSESAGDTTQFVDPVIAQQETTATNSSKIRPPIKAEKSPFVLFLVHGDCIVLDGDNFEYSIKRDGTSFLLIASHEKA